MDIYYTGFSLPHQPLAVEEDSPPSSNDYGAHEGAGAPYAGPTSTSSTLPPSLSPVESVASFISTVPTSTTSKRHSDSSGTTTHDATLPSPSLRAATPPSPHLNFLEMQDEISRLCVEVMATYQCLVSFTVLEAPLLGVGEATNGKGTQVPVVGFGKVFNFHLSGGYQQVMSARGAILRDHPFKRTSVVKVPRSEVLDSSENVKAEMRKKLDEIAAITKAHLAIVGQVSANMGFGLETERNVEIVITGPYESVEQARVRLLVLLDELSGLHSEVCEIDYKLHNIISGRKRCVVQTIQEDTGTNIYFPTPLSGVLGTKNPSLLAKQNLIFITGEFFGVQRARDMLFQVSLHKSKCIISRDTAILPRKLDWMLTDRLEELKSTMYDNGTFINFPPVGSQASLISVYGDHRVNIERTIRCVMSMACQFYVASVWLLPAASFDGFMPPPSFNPSQIPPILRHLSTTSGAESVFKSNCFELHGLESEVRAAVHLVLELEFVKAFHHEIRFQLELANDHRDFISGKKNGKLNKIKSGNVKIKFETFNDYNFLIDLAGSDTGALHGLTMLQEELPAEISFHVPEAYHKRIIGVGGKNIQRIMKKYGVYVKFSNAEEFAALGGYADNEDNVIARTPAKNGLNLEHLKQSVMELVSLKDKDFVIETISIPRRYHRTLVGEKSIFIHDIESKTNSAVRFPNKETASDVVSIFGPESQVHIAAQMLLDHVPFEAEYRLPHSDEMAALTLSNDFVNLTERVKRDYNITILPWVDRTGAGEETVVRFCLNRSNVDFLATSRDLVEEYLVSRNIMLYPGSLRPRPEDSFADTFPFFNSKLLSTIAADTELRNEPRTSDRKLRLAASSPNIKALFDATPFNYRHTETVQPPFYPNQQPPPPQPSQPTSSSYLQNQAPGDYHWNPSQQSVYSSVGPGSHPSNPIPDDPTPEAVPIKLAPPVTRPIRSYAARAQSLDLGYLGHSARRIPPMHHHHESVSEVSDVLAKLGL